MAWSSTARRARLAQEVAREQERRAELDSQIITCVCAHCGAQKTAELRVTRAWFRDHIDQRTRRCRQVRSVEKIRSLR